MLLTNDILDSAAASFTQRPKISKLKMQLLPKLSIVRAIALILLRILVSILFTVRVVLVETNIGKYHVD
jgi:hypothetical protein